MVPLLHEVADNWRAQRLKGQVSRSLKLTLLQYLQGDGLCYGQGRSDPGAVDGMDHERHGVQLPGLECGGAEARPSPRGDADPGSDPSGCQAHEDDPQGARAVCTNQLRMRGLATIGSHESLPCARRFWLLLKRNCSGSSTCRRARRAWLDSCDMRAKLRAIARRCLTSVMVIRATWRCCRSTR